MMNDDRITSSVLFIDSKFPMQCCIAIRNKLTNFMFNVYFSIGTSNLIDFSNSSILSILNISTEFVYTKN